jgi:hypothetical protein
MMLLTAAARAPGCSGYIDLASQLLLRSML